LFYADRRTDMTELTVTFSPPKKKKTWTKEERIGPAETGRWKSISLSWTIGRLWHSPPCLLEPDIGFNN